MSTILYVYGTLRPGNTEPIEVKGSLYDLGWFPGAVLGGSGTFLCERVEVEDITAVDRYEGYDPSEPDMSLYIRRPYEDGFIYEFNRQPNPIKLIQSGDWLDYTSKERGK